MSPFAFRDRALVLSLFDYCLDAGEPVPWGELVTVFALDLDRPAKTVENALYELARFGALHRTGKPGSRGKADTRAMSATPLGVAWREGELPGLPGEPDDPIEAADLIGDEHEAELEDLAGDIAQTFGHDDEGGS